jgi:ABC-2 type transport system ATP-binding protein
MFPLRIAFERFCPYNVVKSVGVLQKIMIEIKNLTKTYGEHRVLNDFSLHVETGSIVGFLGVNGAGKTTTMKILTGLAFPDTGTILINGESPSLVETRKKIGFMPEVSSFYEYLTGLEFLVFCDSLFGNTRNSRERSEKLLKEVGIYDARNFSIKTYSKGMRQRLSFAQAIIHDPSYIFLDEPLDGLDPLGRKAFKKHIRDLKKRGKTVFFSSHVLFDAEELCDEVVIIHKGRLLYAGPTQEFCKDKPLEEAFVEIIESTENNSL